MKVLNSLASLGITIDELYNPDIEKQIEINLTDKSYSINVILTTMIDSPDCKLSSFGANLWARTNKGVNYEKYKSLPNLQSAIVRKLKEVFDFQGDISFSITNQRLTF